VPFVPEIMHGRAPEVFLNLNKAGTSPYDLYCVGENTMKQTKHIQKRTYTVYKQKY
jgi:hypothetical protein